MSRDWTQEEFKGKDGKMIEECRLITKEGWDNYMFTRKMSEELYKCLLNIVKAESWEEAHSLAEDLIVKYADKFDVAEDEMMFGCDSKAVKECLNEFFALTGTVVLPD